MTGEVSSRIAASIHKLRGQNVMTDEDLASFYGVPTSVLNRAVSRAKDRFPDDFMFRASKEEVAELLSGDPQRGPHRARRPPIVFTEKGVHAISYFLTSERARAISVELIRGFHTMRNIVDDYHTLFGAMQEMKRRQELDSKRLWEVVRSVHELEEFRGELTERALRVARENAARENRGERFDPIRFELDETERRASHHRDLFYLLLAIFGALLTALILFPR